MKKIYLTFCMICCGMALHAQDAADLSDTIHVEPIESARLQGPREATEAEKEYARMLAQDRRDQEQIDMLLPPVDENGQVQTHADFYYPYWGWNTWRLHKGLNMNVSTSVFANFGKGVHHGAGFTQDVSLMYVSNLSDKATLAVGGYLNNMIYDGSNYTTAGITALLGYRFDEHWSAYAFVQKAFSSDNVGAFMYPYGGYFGYGYAHRMGYAPYWDMANRYMNRIGGGVRYEWGNNSYVQIQVEFDRMPNQRQHYPSYNTRRYGYPVR